MNYQRQQQNPRGSGGRHLIRNGLSVQELKAITAVRVGVAHEIDDTVIAPSASDPSLCPNNNVSSYDTATPQQMAVAGLVIRSSGSAQIHNTMNAIPHQSVHHQQYTAPNINPPARVPYFSRGTSDANAMHNGYGNNSSQNFEGDQQHQYSAMYQQGPRRHQVLGHEFRAQQEVAAVSTGGSAMSVNALKAMTRQRLAQGQMTESGSSQFQLSNSYANQHQEEFAHLQASALLGSNSEFQPQNFSQSQSYALKGDESSYSDSGDILWHPSGEVLPYGHTNGGAQRIPSSSIERRNPRLNGTYDNHFQQGQLDFNLSRAQQTELPAKQGIHVHRGDLEVGSDQRHSPRKYPGDTFYVGSNDQHYQYLPPLSEPGNISPRGHQMYQDANSYSNLMASGSTQRPDIYTRNGTPPISSIYFGSENYPAEASIGSSTTDPLGDRRPSLQGLSVLTVEPANLSSSILPRLNSPKSSPTNTAELHLSRIGARKLSLGGYRADQNSSFNFQGFDQGNNSSLFSTWNQQDDENMTFNRKPIVHVAEGLSANGGDTNHAPSQIYAQGIPPLRSRTSSELASEIVESILGPSPSNSPRKSSFGNEDSASHKIRSQSFQVASVSKLLSLQSLREDKPPLLKNASLPQLQSLQEPSEVPNKAILMDGWSSGRKEHIAENFSDFDADDAILCITNPDNYHFESEDESSPVTIVSRVNSIAQAGNRLE